MTALSAHLFCSLERIAIASLTEDEPEKWGGTDTRGDRAGEEFREAPRESIANGVVALVVPLIPGLDLASLTHRANLLASMFTETRKAG